jgi:hypothetical protein
MSMAVFAQSNTDEQKRDLAFYTATNEWFSAWKLVSKDIYKINKVKPVTFVFFDDKYVYATSTTTIKKGTTVKGCNLLNLNLKWRKALHNDSLLLPDHSTVPVGLLSFAAEIPNKNNQSFFVMPLPSFWKQAGVVSKELGLENLITGVFIHEFSHSQQMQNFGKKITEYEQQNNFGVDFSDDIVQTIFNKDTSYLKYYKKELTLFYDATKDTLLDKVLVKQGMAIMQQRQTTYFTERYKNLGQIDNFFLTMEGLGQYSMFLWLIHPKGGNIKRTIAIEGVRRGGKWWSQDEGLALFLILDKLTISKDWAKDMFGYKIKSVIAFINEIILLRHIGTP